MRAERPFERRSVVRAEMRIRCGFLQGLDTGCEITCAVGGEASLAQAVAGERLVDEAGRRAVQDEPDPAVPVLARRERDVEAADLEQTRTTHRAVEDEVPLEDAVPLVVDDERIGPR